MKLDILGEANKDRLLVEHFLAIENYLPCKHRCRKTMDALGQILIGFCELISQAQFSFSTVAQMYTPIKVLSHNNPCRYHFHYCTNTLDTPRVCLYHRLLCRPH